MCKALDTKDSFAIQYWQLYLFPIERNGSYGNATLRLKIFFSIKILINLNQMTVNSLFFRLTGSTTIASAFAISEERSNLPWICPMTSRGKILVPRDTADHFVKKLAFVLLRKLLYSNEILENWQRGTIKYYGNKKLCNILNIDFAIENITQTQQTKKIQ